MENFLAQLPSILLAQTLGVGLALCVDALSWKWRRGEEAVFCFAFVGLATFLMLALVAPSSFRLPLFLIALWLLLVAWIQKRQWKLMFWDAFFGALMQLTCFCLAIFASLLLLYFNWPERFDGFTLLWFVSALLTHALLSRFRPTILGAWNALRENSGAKRRLR